MFGAQPCHASDFNLNFAMMLVCMLCHYGCSPIQRCTHKLHSGRHAMNTVRNCCTAAISHIPNCMLKGKHWFAPIHHKRWCESSAGTLGRVQRKFSHRQQNVPVALPCCYITTQNLLYATMHTFCLTISLRMVCCRHVLSATHCPHQCAPKP